MQPNQTATTSQQELKSHWENVYDTKEDSQTSWFQQVPQTSLDLIEKYASRNNSGDMADNEKKSFIDVGCGNSHLTFELLKRGNLFSHYYMVDISKSALERSQQLMKDVDQLVDKVSFIESNVLMLDTILTQNEMIDLWHDRATFHFLNSTEEQIQYMKIMCKLLKKGGHFLISTFSSNGGPTKCSGLPITQYSVEKWKEMFEMIEACQKFELIHSFEQVHTTPFNTTQQFLFCIFKKLE